MLSCCCFCSGKFQSPRTEHLSSPLLLSSLPSEPPVCFPVFFCSFCFIPLLLQISPLITEVEKIFGDPWLFPAAFSHCCIVGGNHGIHVHVLIARRCKKSQFQISSNFGQVYHYAVMQKLKFMQEFTSAIYVECLHSSLQAKLLMRNCARAKMQKHVFVVYKVI